MRLKANAVWSGVEWSIGEGEIGRRIEKRRNEPVNGRCLSMVETIETVRGKARRVPKTLEGYILQSILG